MGTGSKVVSVILRFGELASAIIVVALLSRFFYLLHIAPDNGPTDGRLIYAQVISCLEMIFSLFLIPPLKYSFYAWPLDIIFFICSIVAFGLLASLDNSCSSNWYWNYWGYYWGRFWTIGPRFTVPFGVIGHTGCSGWRTILAFLFTGSMAWLLSAILGIFVSMEIHEGRETHRARAIKEKVLPTKNRQGDLETQT
ncbi:hypothetical protein B0J11DRAFT_599712 [Dendryphion nanum]|uniref:MARVEL domain-containing protein n=1 Tax=Dendryphion nanum TaxID=256645 RepID=A0A9P9I7R3_9PLEO|nr:hypothetical protein B0J11DRAFT_599712 [Dendryphion nanum]